MLTVADNGTVSPLPEDTTEVVVTVDRENEPRNVAKELIRVTEFVKSIGEYYKMARKECNIMVRRLQLMLPLFEEIGDMEDPIPQSAIECLEKLKHAFRSAKKLLTTCHCGSKIYLALEAEAVMGKFNRVYGEVSQALVGMPFDELGISDEEREQVELLCTQLRRAKRRSDTMDMEFTMDLMVVFSNKDDRSGEIASIERMANKLSLLTEEELKAETWAIKKVVNGKRGNNYKNADQRNQRMVDLLNRFKAFAGLPQTPILDDPFFHKTLDKSPSLAIPHEFLCPITLEIMKDPVVVETGQTYERESIQQWLDSNHQTCPKTGQPLVHLSLAPNFALRQVIQQWCEKNNFQLPKKKESSSATKPKDSTTEIEAKISSLVRDLSSNNLDVQRKAVAEIRMLSKENPENRILIASKGGIPPIVQLLHYPDSKIQEQAVTALLNLSINEKNKKLISIENPFPNIIEILEKGTVGAKENSAATLFSLSMLDENKLRIGQLNGIPPLITLLEKGTIRGKKDAVTALCNLCLSSANKTRAIEAGIVEVLLKGLVNDHNMIDEILNVLRHLAMIPQGRKEIGNLTFIETLVRLIRDGTATNKEWATAVLLELGLHNSNLILAALQYGVYEPLAEVANNGTDRGRRKANSILDLMTKVEQIS